MLSLFVGCLLPVKSDLGIALSVSNASHCKIHTYLAAFAVEVLAETFDNSLVYALGYAYNVLSGPGLFACLLLELVGLSLADGASVGGRVAFVNVTADGAYLLFHNFFLQKYI